VHSTSWRETYAGLLPDEVIANAGFEPALLRWRERLPAKPPQAVLVWDHPVSGFAYCGPEREGDPNYRGEVYAIYVLAARQGAGGGRRLMAEAAGRLLAAGMSSMLVWVLRDNHSARGFYEHLGGAHVREKPLGWPGSDAIEVAYGWADTTALRSGGEG
jgi:GNAT superfamily N-acetyltransferase